MLKTLDYQIVKANKSHIKIVRAKVTLNPAICTQKIVFVILKIFPACQYFGAFKGLIIRLASSIQSLSWRFI